MMGRGGLKRLAAALDLEVGRAVLQGARLVEDRAKGLIFEGSVSGKGHVASRPGEAPNNNLGDLVRGISHDQTGATSAVVISQSQAALSLEVGTSRMAARPYMGPAAMMEADGISKLVAGAVGRAAAKAQTN
ncbi:HK97 gp10 family phage protein [uncultured Sphingomonas sp.]|uniref:HK97 gp10 family phage protein n=1 Tax=uncultured Sphingomonas sp. TaxID=158754 RepID=UPI0025894F90|nr:HK97 gp10 family phage protein [uncultured Sphingomonas sp.]